MIDEAVAVFTGQQSAPAQPEAAKPEGEAQPPVENAPQPDLDKPADAPKEGEPKADEPKTETKEEKKDAEKLLSPRFAQLAKAERELQKQREAFKAEQKPFLEWQESKKNALKNPIKWLEANGLTYEQLTDFVLSGDNKKDARVLELESRLSEAEKREKEREARAEQAANQKVIDDHKSAIKELCLKGGEQYELINALGHFDAVFDLIAENYQVTGKILTQLEAAKLVEDELEKDAQKYTSVKKFQKLFGVGQKAPEPEKASEPSASPQSAPSKTLTNGAASGSTETVPQFASEAEEIAYVAKMLTAR